MERVNVNKTRRWGDRRALLTDVLASEAVDERGEIEIARYDGHLVRRLVGEIERLAIGAAEQEQPGARLLVVDGAHVQGRVARRVLPVHVGTVKQQVLQMLHEPVAARL